MDCRTHERGVGMLNTPYVKKDTIKNFFPVPNAVFDLCSATRFLRNSDRIIEKK